MSVASELLPLSDTVAPPDQPALAAAVREAYAAQTAIYPIGGGTSLDYGLPAKQPGWGLSLANLARVVDYPARDMTITVEAGIRMTALVELLATQRQRLPIDAPQKEQATLGGVVATNTSGPRRYGRGTIRDYVIGISAVDGRGTAFKGGGRVVKNVAGYDFCKLLTGSLGTLGVITQLTLKVTPLPETSAFAACAVASLDAAETVLAHLVTSRTTPAAVELLVGPAWPDDAVLKELAPGSIARVVVGLEGTRTEVDWQIGQLTAEWAALGNSVCKTSTAITDAPDVARLWQRLTDFPVAGRESPLVVRANVLPSHVTGFIGLVRGVDPECSIQAHAGNGIIIGRFSELAPSALIGALVHHLQPAARAAGGSMIVLSASSPGELTRQVVWGPARGDLRWMTAVKRQFDPLGLLNPGRFVY